MIQLLIKAAFALAQTVSVYTLSFTNADGDTVNMSSLQGKKILLVNIALNSEHASQLAELEQLRQQYSDSLTIIVFPSDDFGNCPQATADIKSTLQTQYNANYLIAEKSHVKSGEAYSQTALYQWLNSAEDNGRFAVSPKGDFYKFLIGSDGMLIGIFKGSVTPMSSEMQTVLNR